MTPVEPAAALLQSLGIDRSSEIDIEAIAWSVGATVRIGLVESCEARLIGYRDRAIITVGRGSDWRRRRFSVAHELGHWHHHRGRISICRSSDIGSPASRSHPIEREADAYAANLLMPRFLFENSVALRDYRTLGVVDSLSREYRSSRLATLLRIIELDLWPCMIIYHQSTGRRWFRKSLSFPIERAPRNDIDAGSSAGTVRNHHLERTRRREADPAHWFEGRMTMDIDFHEQSCRSFDGSILSLLVAARLATLS